MGQVQILLPEGIAEAEPLEAPRISCQVWKGWLDDATGAAKEAAHWTGSEVVARQGHGVLRAYSEWVQEGHQAATLNLKNGELESRREISSCGSHLEVLLQHSLSTKLYIVPVGKGNMFTGFGFSITKRGKEGWIWN